MLCQILITQPDYRSKKNEKSDTLKKAAGIVNVKKELTIKGVSNEYQLTDPISFKIADDNTIFVKDWGRAIYKFSNTGKFLIDLYRKGEGPGELKNILSYFLIDSKIIQFTNYPNKIVEKNFSGDLIREFNIPINGVLRLIGIDNHHIYFTKAEIGKNTKKISDKFQDMTMFYRFYSWDTKNNIIKKSNILFRNIRRTKNLKNGWMIMVDSPSHFLYISDLCENSIYYVNSHSYKIGKISTKTDQIQFFFSRPYKRIKYFHPIDHSEEQKKVDNSGSPPDKEYFPDVIKIFNRGSELWVVTSTVEKRKGVLIDVFSDDGDYKDKFFLNIPGIDTPHLPEFNISKDKVLVLGADDAENPIVNVYTILK